MMRQRFTIPDYGWEVFVFYNTGSMDAEEVLAMLQVIGVSAFDYTVALTNMMSNTLDTGFCCSNYSSRKSVMVISETSTPEQFMNSFMHETRHLERHIENALGIAPYGEEAAYLAGIIGGLMFPKARLFMCKCYSQMVS